MKAKQVKLRGTKVRLLKKSKYIDPLSDWGFKRLFGSEPQKEILIDFLNALFEGHKQIVDLVYSPTEYSGESKETSKVFFDLNCTGADGENFVIEMQRGEQLYFSDRVVYYLSRLVSEQFKNGETDWRNKGLKEVYLISLLDFVLSNSTEKRYLRNITLSDTETGEVFYSKLAYKFIELPNFVKTEAELVTNIDKWLYLLKNLNTLKKIPALLNKRIFERVFKIAEIANLTNEERVMYNASLKSKMDYDGSIAFAEDRAFEKGLEKGAQLERAKAESEKRETACNLKNMSMPVEDIAKVTGLSIQEIEAL